MNIVTDKQVKVFRRDNEFGTFYSLGISKKNQNGSYEKGYMPCQFKKDVSVENQSMIYIRNAWLSFYLKDKETKPYVFINEFETVGETIQKAKEEVKTEVREDPWQEFSNEVEIDESSLPF